MSKWYSFEDLKRARTPMPLDSETGLPDNHVITVVERVISVDNSELIQNNVRTDTFTLNLDAEYDDLNVIVIFTKSNNINVQVAYSGQPAHIPASVMELTGSVAVSVVGLDDEGETRAVTKAAPDTFQVVASGAYTGKISQDDVDLLGQILKAVSDAETAITAAANATSQAKSAATSANQAASSANSAASSANSAATKANSAAVDAQNAYDTLQPYMATIDSCANILHREVGPDSVVTADDAFPCKPVEMTVYGNTVQNLWVNPSGTNNGVTVTSNTDGSITVNGTATNDAIVRVISYALKPTGKYTLSIDKSVSSVSGCGVSVEWYKDDTPVSNIVIGNGSTLSRTFTIPSDTEYCKLKFRVPSSTTVSGTYRIMLNEGSEAEPWCPPGLNSVGQLREDEKNLWVNPSGTNSGVTATVNDDGTITLSGTNATQGTVYVMSSDYILDVEEGETFTLSCEGMVRDASWGFLAVGYNDQNVQTPGDKSLAYVYGTKPQQSFTIPSGTTKLQARLMVQPENTVSGTYKVMLNKGSKASLWVPPESESCVQVLTAGKNLFTVKPGAGVTDAGVTYDYLGDGAFHVHGTATDRSYCSVDYTASVGYLDYVGFRGKTLTASRDSDIVDCYFGYFVGQVGGAYEAMINLVSGESASAVVPDDATWARSVLTVASGTTVDEIVHVQLELGSAATDYEPPNITTTPIDLQGHTLNALPNGTRDELRIDGGGNVVLEKRTQTVQLDGDAVWLRFDTPFIGYSTPWQNFGGSPTGVTANLYIDKLTTSNAIRNGLYSASPTGNYAYVRDPTFASDAAGVKEWMSTNKPVAILPLLEPQTISLGTITPPTMAEPNVTAYVADDTPAEIELDYVRDINVVVDRLEKKVAGLAVMEATNV